MGKTSHEERRGEVQSTKNKKHTFLKEAATMEIKVEMCFGFLYRRGEVTISQSVAGLETFT